MSKDSAYQRVRSHLSYLKLQTASERLAPALEAAEREQPAYAEFLDRLARVRRPHPHRPRRVDEPPAR